MYMYGMAIKTCITSLQMLLLRIGRSTTGLGTSASSLDSPGFQDQYLDPNQGQLENLRCHNQDLFLLIVSNVDLDIVGIPQVLTICDIMKDFRMLVENRVDEANRTLTGLATFTIDKSQDRSENW